MALPTLPAWLERALVKINEKVQADRKTLEDENEQMRSALEQADEGFSDWLVDFADDHHDPEAVLEARKRISENGTIGYITSKLDVIRTALATEGE